MYKEIKDSYSYYYNEHKNTVEIYKDNCLYCEISEVYNEEQAEELFEDELSYI